MPLPRINTPTYELELPSTGKKIKYRPFLVREEKILLIALESEDMKQITNAVVSILTDCIQTRGIKVSDLSTFDIEYLFLNIRSRSVGETVEEFCYCFKVENLRMIPGNYRVEISKSNIALFTNRDYDVKYWIALEP